MSLGHLNVAFVSSRAERYRRAAFAWICAERDAECALREMTAATTTHTRADAYTAYGAALDREAQAAGELARAAAPTRSCTGFSPSR
jgi:hypothetical protein